MSGPIAVVVPDPLTREALIEQTRSVLPGRNLYRIDSQSTAPFDTNSVLFILLAPEAPWPDVPLVPPEVPIVCVGYLRETPQGVEVFRLADHERNAFLPLLRALVGRQCSSCTAHRNDETVAQLSKTLMQEVPRLDRVVEILGTALQASRVTVHRLQAEGSVHTPTHRWCSPLSSSHDEDGVGRRLIEPLLQRLQVEPVVQLDSVTEFAREIGAFQAADGEAPRAILMAPLRMSDGQLSGALVAEQIDDPRRWTARDVRLLVVAGEMLSSFFEKSSAQAAVREKEARHRQVLGQLQEGLFLAAADGSRVDYVSPAAATLFGMPAADSPRAIEEWLSPVHPDDRSRVLARIRASSDRREREPLEFRVSARDDAREHTIRARVFHVRSGDGATASIGGLLEDVTQQNEEQTRLRFLTRLYETTAEAVIVTDSDARIVDVNPAFTRITGYRRNELLGENPRKMSSGRHDRAFFEAMWRSLLAEGHWHGEVWDRRKDGVIFPKLLTIEAIRNDDGKTVNYIGIFSDISEAKATEANLQHFVHHDALTDLPNRLLFHDRLDQALAYARRSGYQVGIMFVDLDGFKRINDHFGHRAGDALLVEVAERIRSQMRATDTLARLGGDQFTAICTRLTGRHTAAHVAAKWLDVLSRPFLSGGEWVQLSASIGISLFPDSANEVDELLRMAARALGNAKKAGGNVFCFAEATSGTMEKTACD